MKRYDDLLKKIRKHIPEDAPPLEGYVPGHYFQCDCRRTGKRIRFEMEKRGWRSQNYRMRRIPILDEEGMEIGHRTTPYDENGTFEQRYEKLPKPLQRPGNVTAHPKPWLLDQQEDDEESGHEGSYCLDCALKIRSQVFSRITDGSAICDFIRYDDNASGSCAECGVTLEGEPEDLRQELGHWEESPPEHVAEWQQLERVVEKFDWELCDREKDKKGELLTLVCDIVKTAEEYARRKQSSAVDALVFLWESQIPTASKRDAKSYRQCADQVRQCLESKGDTKALIQSWLDEDARLRAIREKYQGKIKWEDMTEEQRAEFSESNGEWFLTMRAHELRSTLHPEDDPKYKPIYHRKWHPVVNDPKAIRVQFARKWFTASLRDMPKHRKMAPWDHSPHAIEYNERAVARHEARKARLTVRWQYLLKELGIEAAKAWLDEGRIQTQHHEQVLAKHIEKSKEYAWAYNETLTVSYTRALQDIKDKLAYLKSWVDATWPESTEESCSARVD